MLRVPSPRILGPSARENRGDECSNRKLQSVKSLSVILPAFNEEANIRAVVEDAYRNIPKFAPIFEIIVVNDGSKDRTGEICDRLAEEFSDVRVVHHPRNRGYGAALKSGIERARYDLIFFTDADGQFDLKEVAALLEQTDATPTISLLGTAPGDRIRRTGCCLPGVGISSCGSCSGSGSVTLTALSKSSTAMSSIGSRSSVWARWLTRKSSLRHSGLA